MPERDLVLGLIDSCDILPCAVTAEAQMQGQPDSQGCDKHCDRRHQAGCDEPSLHEGGLAARAGGDCRRWAHTRRDAGLGPGRGL